VRLSHLYDILKTIHPGPNALDEQKIYYTKINQTQLKSEDFLLFFTFLESELRRWFIELEI
jgi:hypothetical protein